jgi:hypothetical protein
VWHVRARSLLSSTSEKYVDAMKNIREKECHCP